MLFLDNKYTKWYYNIIDNRRIIPKELGFNFISKENLNYE